MLIVFTVWHGLDVVLFAVGTSLLTQLLGGWQPIKKLNVGEIKAISRSVCKPTSATATLILEAVKRSRHILSFPGRKEQSDQESCLTTSASWCNILWRITQNYTRLQKEGQNTLIFK